VKSGDYDGAAHQASGALKTNPNLAPAYVTNAQVSLAKGDTKQGEAQLEEALKRDPSSLPALSQMLKLYISQGKTQQAAQRLSQLIQQNPKQVGTSFPARSCLLQHEGSSEVRSQPAASH